MSLDPFGNELEESNEVTGSLDAFFNQPSVGGGPSWSFVGKEPGFTYTGVVSRAVTNRDIVQQTDRGTNAPVYYRDGSPKWVMKVPLKVSVNDQFPEGKAQWYVSGLASTELAQAMADAGAPAGPPEPGAKIAVTYGGQRTLPQSNFKQNIIKVKYERPGEAPSASAPGPVVEEAKVAASPSSTQPHKVDLSALSPEQLELLKGLGAA